MIEKLVVEEVSPLCEKYGLEPPVHGDNIDRMLFDLLVAMDKRLDALENKITQVTYYAK